MSILSQENVQTYPRPPVVEPVLQRIVILLGDKVIADTIGALRVLETHHAPTYYISRQDITADLLPVDGNSFCEWKGAARYFNVTAGDKTAKRAAWSYDHPTLAFKPLAGYFAFYAGMMDECFVGDEKVMPQPGDFYGGWVTSNLDGIPKGARGTEYW